MMRGRLLTPRRKMILHSSFMMQGWCRSLCLNQWFRKAASGVCWQQNAGKQKRRRKKHTLSITYSNSFMMKQKRRQGSDWLKKNGIKLPPSWSNWWAWNLETIRLKYWACRRFFKNRTLCDGCLGRSVSFLHKTGKKLYALVLQGFGYESSLFYCHSQWQRQLRDSVQ